MSQFLPKPLVYSGVAVVIGIGACYYLRTSNKDGAIEFANKYGIEPLSDFDFHATDPIKYQPYIRKATSRWESRNARETTPKWIRRELYREVMVQYLPWRFPTMFRPRTTTTTTTRDGTIRANTNSTVVVDNVATGTQYPATGLDDLSTSKLLSLMAENIEEDFYIMAPDPDLDQWRLQGYIVCFPGGFLSPARVGESAREIHRAVPGFDEKQGPSITRYFKKMQPGDFIGRMNWGLQVDGADLFRTDGNNFYSGTNQAVDEGKFDTDFDECFLRVEHQALTKLLKTKSIIFTVRSYMTPLRQVKADGDGHRLADAVESMPEGLSVYKMRQYWGSKVLPWLRDETSETAP